jgi:wyosine [tRNA(Phe)-imidazoG37] synthetase (radical SAM superfamily)
MQVKRGAFYEPEKVLRDVHDKVEKARETGEAIDYLTFVSDGEPTLDINLGHEIELLRPLGIKIAVISNGSLIGREEVREDLLGADWPVVRELVEQGRFVEMAYEGHKFVSSQ